MIEAAPKRIFSGSYLVRSPGGATVELDLASWRERGRFELDGIPYRLYREGAMKGDFVLERDGAVIARATKPSAFRHRFQLEVNGHHLTLRRPSVWRRDFEVCDGDVRVGRIAPAGAFTRRALVELPTDWALPLQLFLLWLVLLMWRRDAAAAAS